MTQIAFIGLGNMGAGMAANLAKAGHRILAFDLSQPALKRAKDAGCEIAQSGREAVAEADAVITMLPAGHHVKAVYEADILPHAKAGAMLIDCSTIDMETARDVAQQASAQGFKVADAPVSGGMAAAQAGRLAFMVGCEPDLFADSEAILQPMAKVVLHAGASGAGQAAKLCNNMVLAITMIGTCEAFNLAEKLGLDAEKFFAIASQSSAQSWSLTSYCPVAGLVPTSPANRDYQPGFAGAMMLKDLHLAMQAAGGQAAKTPLGQLTTTLFEDFCANGGDIRDFSAIIENLR